MSQYNACSGLIDNLCKAIDKVNTDLTDNMTKQKGAVGETPTSYDIVCLKPVLTYDHFYKSVKKEFEDILGKMINHPGTCSSSVSKFQSIYQTYQIVAEAKDTLLQAKDANEFVFDELANVMTRMTGQYTFNFSENVLETLVSLAKALENNCQCRFLDLFEHVLQKYHKYFATKFAGKDKKQISAMIKQEFETVSQTLKQVDTSKLTLQRDQVLELTSKNLTSLFNFSIESELNKLIPDELGSLKQFFVKVISTYYNNIHPIIWCQIFKYFLENVFVELPVTPDDMFGFISKSLLLNSGPFILKIMQTVRPVLTPELAKKYNLTKLKYPLLKQHQVDVILKKVISDYDMYNVMVNVSASVGHVCIVNKVSRPDEVFIVKIIKPLSIAQSCWEYKTLYNIFDKKSCEASFVKSMLVSNGEEMNVQNEIKNLIEGHQYYTASYSDIFGVSMNANITTVEYVKGITTDDCWFAFGMSLAKGIPVSDLVENDLINEDTPYRAKLHRCLDLLVYTFFLTLIKDGYYHGDLHAGNVFFSYENSTLTLIDFGAVGKIDLYNGDPTVNVLIEVIILSLFYNYDGILDVMTDLINSKCTESKIDKQSAEYAKFKKELESYKFDNIRNFDKEKKKFKQYSYDIFSERRISDEVKNERNFKKDDNKFAENIYSKLEYKQKGKEPIIENKDVLPVFTEVLGDTKSVTFAKVLELIIKFYATNGVNVAIKFNDLFQLQKSYVLLLGVLAKVGYNSYRYNIAIEKAIVNIQHLPVIQHVSLVAFVAKKYWDENNKYVELKKKLGTTPVAQTTSTYVEPLQGGALAHEEILRLQKSGKISNKEAYLRLKAEYLRLKNGRK